MIATALLLRPKIPERETFDEEALLDLVESIQATGLVQPIIVRAEGACYRVIAGDRRLAACRALELPEVQCVIRPPNDLPDFAITAAENTGREEVNPAEEARYFMRLLVEECGNDMDRLSAGLRKTREYIDGRLALLAGDPLVLQALAEGAISIGVSQEMNKVNDPAHRRMLLEVCIKQGAAVRQARQWRIDDNLMTAGAPVPEVTQEPAGVTDRPAPITTMTCLFCGDSEDAWDMEILYAHRRCRKIKEREAAAAQPAAG